MINVLVTSVGSNTAIGVIKALRTNTGISITGTDIFPAHLSAGSSHTDYFYEVPPAMADEYESALIKIIAERTIQCVIPIHDVEVKKIAALAFKYPALTGWAVNTTDIIALCNNKKKINTYLSEHKIPVPEMYDSVTEISYPALYKPNEGVSSKGIQFINNADESNLPFDLSNGFLQKLVAGVEYTVDCYSAYNEDYFNCCVRKRIETKEGISTKGVTVDFPLLAEISRKIHQVLNYKGASNIQFIVENDKAYFIEINPRFSGAGILSYHANLNSPLFTVLELIKSQFFNEIKNIPVKTGIFMTRYWSENFYEG
jgi:carbamoyl-phosphate synthase large subunit